MADGQLTAERGPIPETGWTLWPLERAPVVGSSGAAAPSAPDDPVAKRIPTPRHWLLEAHATPLNEPIPETFSTAAPSVDVTSIEANRTLAPNAAAKSLPNRTVQSSIWGNDQPPTLMPGLPIARYGNARDL
jgi:hypothetical protein